MRCLKDFTGKAKNMGLVLKIFFRVTPPGLWPRVLGNTLKNLAGSRIPASAVIGATYRCQLGCEHCSAGLYKRDGRELTLEEWKTVLSQAYKLGVPRLNISGGEALLRTDILELIRFASARFVTVLESNGETLDAGKIKDLKKAGLACAAVSIDSPDPAEHDRLRRKAGCFAAAKRALGLCAGAGLPAVISTYVTAERAGAANLSALEELARDTGAIAVRVMPARPVGNFCRSADSALSPGQEKLIMETMDRSLCYFKGLPGPEECGIFKRNTFYISPYGEVQPCAYLPLAFGDVPAEPLAVVLERMWTHRIFDAPRRQCLILDAAFRAEHLPGTEDFAGKLPVRVK
jgi:MoaA/NifB/PqqE/SkfB family radical SAM enzyme